MHFDDFVVEHEGISIVQQDDYYAFGAPFRQQPGVGLKNKYLYQGKEWQSELNLALYDFHARQYDPYLGSHVDLLGLPTRQNEHRSR